LAPALALSPEPCLHALLSGGWTLTMRRRETMKKVRKARKVRGA
jgi:hypothetical protein